MNTGASCLHALAGVVLVLVGGSCLDASPIPLTPASFDCDVVVEATATNDPVNHYAGYVNGTMDLPLARPPSLYTWFEQGFDPAHPTRGLPAGAGLFTSQADGQTQFLLQPYTANNARLIDLGRPPGSLSFVTPRAYTHLSFLTAASYANHAPAIFTVKANFSDGAASLVLGTVKSPDWVWGWGDSAGAPPVAWHAGNRVAVETGEFDLGLQDYPGAMMTTPRLFQAELDLPVAAQQHPISSLTLAYTTNGQDSPHIMVFAVSGTPVPEPGTLVMLGGLGVLVGRRRR